jgi:hypothetical protein
MLGRFFFAVGFVLLGLASATQAATTISLPTLTNTPVGNMVTVHVNMNASPSIGGILLQIQYNPAVLALQSDSDVVKGPRAGTQNLVVNRFPTLISTNPATGAGVRMVLFGTSSIGGNGTLLDLKFRVVGIGSTPLLIAQCQHDDPPVDCSIQNGSFSTNVCSPTTETCNGVDDNCNNQIDDGFDVGTGCSVGVGACQRNGVKQCTGDGAGTACNVVPGEPEEEGLNTATDTCGDNIDNDCDGAIDAQDPDCQASGFDTLIPGGGSSKTDCMAEWKLENVTLAVNTKGIPLNKQSCTDGAACDANLEVGKCTFLVSICLHVPDTRLTNSQGTPACLLSDVALIDPKNIPDSLVTQLTNLGGQEQGLCTNRGAKKGNLCQHNVDCDTAPGKGDGKCGQFIAFTPPLMAQTCSLSPVPIDVSLNTTPQGALEKRAITLKTNTLSSPQGGGDQRKKDTDSLQLICLPPAQ